jgi:glutamate---cysteine ligase / carboxylate-amine ligase
MNQSEEFTIGVEEEYQIIDPQTRELCGKADKIIQDARKNLDEDVVQPEMYRSQIEIATSVCHNLAEVRQELIRCRKGVVEAAAGQEQAIAASGTHPFSSWQKQEVTPKSRYQNLQQDLKQVIRELIIFGNHVHVGLSDRAIALQVINRARIWLSVLLALSANSPFWMGSKTGYASYRTTMWSRLPLTGQPQIFNSLEEYNALVEDLVATGVIKDPTTIYWDIRISDKFPTIEFRATDICLTVDEAVTIAGLIRALVWTCYQEVLDDVPLNPVRPELLQAAHWYAARYGLTSNLIDVIDRVARPAPEVIAGFLDYLQPALEKFGDWDTISESVGQILENGNGARRQLAIYEQTGSYQDVVDYIVAQTKQGLDVEIKEQGGR